jgi:hypothetical protein
MIMKKLVLVLVFAMIHLLGYSQHSFESTVAIGGTIVDIEALVLIDEVSGTVAEDWGQFSGGLSLQYLYETNRLISLGLEVMYQHLFWYDVRVPYGSYDIYREYSINAFKLAPIIRIGGSGKVALDVGPTVVFRDGVVMGSFMSLNYNIPLSDKLDIPIKARLDYVELYGVNVFPLTLNAGLRIKL